MGTEYANIIVSLLSCFNDAYRDVFGFTTGPPLHDPVAVAYIAAPEILKVCPCTVACARAEMRLCVTGFVH